MDHKCDISVRVNVNGESYEEYGKLDASFGYGSKQDGKTYHLDLCEKCFIVAVYALRHERKSHVMFDEEQKLSDKNFGLETYPNVVPASCISPMSDCETLINVQNMHFAN